MFFFIIIIISKHYNLQLKHWKHEGQYNISLPLSISGVFLFYCSLGELNVRVWCERQIYESGQINLILYSPTSQITNMPQGT